MVSSKLVKHIHIINTLFLPENTPNYDATKIREVWVFIEL
jgi:hypothetical protein